MKWLKTYEELVNSEYKCSICGSNLYVTHEGGIKITLQCSSDEAKFWEFPRGSKEQKKSHKHFMESIKYIDKNQS
jgi:ribosomal protein L33